MTTTVVTLYRGFIQACFPPDRAVIPAGTTLLLPERVKMSTATRSEKEKDEHEEQQQQQQERRDDATDDATDEDDPLAGLTESGRLALLIRFGAAGSKGGMCAAMSHGHSFQSSIFRLPAKCAACHELVWGPFKRGCTCLTCSMTVHRSCTGVATMPQCPTKNVFDAFCRSELRLPPVSARPATTSAGGAAAAGSTSAAAASTGAGGYQKGAIPAGATSRTGEESGESSGAGTSTAAAAAAGAAAGGDLEEWAKVDGTSGHSNSAVTVEAQNPPASASCAIQDLGSSFSWSPLGLGERKRPVSESTGERQQQQERVGDRDAEMETASGVDDDAALLSAPGITAPEKDEDSGTVPNTAATADLGTSAVAVAASTTGDSNGNTMGIRGVTKMSVAGGVVGAFFGGPVGAVVGLKLGLVLGAGRSVQQGLWQRIEKNRREAGAEGIGLPNSVDGASAVAVAVGVDEEEAARKPRDVWARIAQQIEGEQQPVIWYVLKLLLDGGGVS